MKVLFVCWINIGRSQMAKALYNNLTGTNNADGAGIAVDRIIPEAKTVKDFEIHTSKSRSRQSFIDNYGIDFGDSPRRQLTPEMLTEYPLVVNIAERRQTPEWLQGNNVIWWDVQDPGDETGLAIVEAAREKIDTRVRQLIACEQSGGDFHTLDDSQRATEEAKK